MPYDLPEEAMAPGTRPAGPSGTPLPPPNIPDHKLLRRIGGGSYGEVWLARNVVGTYRAVKVVYRKSFERDRPYDREFAGIQKFEPISRSHEGLVDILQIGRNDDAGYFYYVMELADAVGEAGEKVGEWESEKDATGSRLGPALLNSETYTPKTLRSLLLPPAHFPTRPPAGPAPLPLAQCLDIGLALTAALAHLHKHGLVHRDIKPSNIIFVDGAPKLADIGLVTDMSEARSFVGTDGFIPPEGPGTPQADLYSLGKVLYEMSTGKDRHDFPELPPAMKESAERAGLSELNEIILKACAGDVSERYQNAEEMRADLALLQQGQSVKRRRALECRLALAKKLSLAAAALALLVFGGWLLSNRFHVVKVQRSAAPSSPASALVATKSIAVLPFDNESPDKADEYLGTQIAEELSGALKKIAALHVLAQDSAVVLKYATNRLATALQLKLDAMIVGKVRKAGTELHLTAEIINPGDGKVTWSSPPYGGARKDIFAMQTELARRVAEALDVQLTAAGRQELELKPALNLAAYDFYFLGRRHLNERTPAGMRRAMERFQQAIQQDPNYARAYAGLADCYGLFPGTFPSYQEAWTSARENSEKAVQLDPNLGEAHGSLGLVLENFDWDWKGAETEFEHALQLDPNNATVRSWYAVHLARLGKYEAGIQQARLAQEIDPLSAIRPWVSCWLLTADRQYAAAIEEFERNLRLTPSQRAAQTVGYCYFYLGRYEAGIAAHQQAALSFGVDSEEVRSRSAALRVAYLASGPEGYWRKVLELAMARWKEEHDATPIAVINAWLGDKEQTLAWLEKAVAARSHGIINLNLIPELDLVRSEPRYQALLRKLGLPKVGPTNAPTQPEVTSIAVVPFVNEDKRVRSGYFSLSLAEGVSTALTNVAGVRVATLASVLAFRGKTNDAPDIGRKIGVQWVLQAVFRNDLATRSNQMIVVTKLTHLPDGARVWSANYDRTLDDLVAIQREVLTNVTHALGVSTPVLELERMETNLLRKVAAWQLAVRGDKQLHLGTREGYEEGVKSLHQALALDPTYSHPHSMLAWGYSTASEWHLPPHTAMLQAKSWASRTLALDNLASFAHCILGDVLFRYDWDLKGAEEAYRYAIQIEPYSAANHAHYASVLLVSGRASEALAEQELAIRLDPSDLSYVVGLADMLIVEKNYDAALKLTQDLLAQHPDYFLGHYVQGRIYEKQGRYEQAMKEYQWVRTRESGPDVLALIGHLHALRGEQEDALRMLGKLEDLGKDRYVAPIFKAVIHLRLGDRTKALDLLEQAREQQCGSLTMLKLDDNWDALRDEPRFQALLRQVRLEK